MSVPLAVLGRPLLHRQLHLHWQAAALTRSIFDNRQQHHEKQQQQQRPAASSPFSKILSCFIIAGVAGFGVLVATSEDQADINNKKKKKLQGLVRRMLQQHRLIAETAATSRPAASTATSSFDLHLPGLPEYSMQQVAQHDSSDKRIWVTYRKGVYDITDFVPKHPGAKNIEMAAGSSVEPFWEIYAVHKNNPQVYELLEQHRIGNLKEEDVAANALNNVASTDPFALEPSRHPALRPVSTKPFNAETPLSMVADNFYTPNELFYVRNHLPTPDVQADTYELEIDGLAGSGVRRTVLTLAELKKRFPKHTVTAAIQCGGNRRSEMNKTKPLKGLDWQGGAIGNATWSGARLSDVLAAYGAKLSDADNLHIQFEGSDLGADGSPYGASIPAQKGLDPRGDVLLAYEMNGEVLPRDHGFPVRVVVPGVVGARNVKWVNRILLSDRESDSHWQQNDYKGFGPSVDWGDVDYSKATAIQNMPVTSAICHPESGATVKVKAGERLEVRGYAWSGGGNRIIRVDVTADGGKTWTEAEIVRQDLVREPRHYGWTLWKAEVQIPKAAKEVTVWSKAVDSSYNVQPESFENIWNLRGLLSNAYFRAVYKIV